MKIDELLIGLGFDYDPKDLKRFKRDIAHTTDVIKDLARMAATGAAAIAGISAASSNASDNVAKAADKLGLTTERMSELQYVAGRTKDGVESVETAMTALAAVIGQADSGLGAGVRSFGELGIEIRNANGQLKTTEQILLEVVDGISGMTRLEQIDYAAELGIDDLTKTLQLGRSEIEKLASEARELGIVTDEDAKNAAELQGNFFKISRIIADMARMFSAHFQPIMNDLMSSFIEFWKVNRDIIKEKLPQWLDLAAKAFRALLVVSAAYVGLKIVSSMLSMIKVLAQMRTLAFATAAGFAAMPAAIILLALLMEDAHAYFKGHQSVIGDMLTKYPAWRAQILSVAKGFNLAAKGVQLIWTGLNNIKSILETLTFDKLLEFVKSLPGFLGHITGLKRVDGTGLIPDVVDKAKSTLNSATSAVKPFLPTLTGVSSTVASSHLPPSMGGVITSNSNNRIDKVEINVQGGRDSAERIAETINDKINNLFNQTSNEFNTAVEQ